MKTIIAIALLAAGLTGCASAEERARREAAAMAQMNAEDDAYCKSYGVEKGKPGYVECRNKLTEIRAANGIVAAQNQAAAARTMQATGAALLQNAQPRPMPMTTTNCVPTAMGVRCTSF